MKFTRLRYSSYRNLERVELEPSENFNVFWGRNAQGKTNIIEGIYLLGHLKSFRTVLTQNLIGHDSGQAEVGGEWICRSVTHRLDLKLTRQGKEIYLDEKRPRRIYDVAEIMRQVLFAPEEVASVKGAPGLRRNLVDRAIYQLQPSYLERMQNYYRILKQRNILLREGKDEALIDTWKEGLIVEGAHIYNERQVFIEKIRPFFEAIYQQLTQNTEFPEVRLRQGVVAELEEQQQILKEEFERYKKQERQRGTTQVGPHRDDPGFLINDRDLRNHGSQGQQRTFILAFKIALLKLLKHQNGSSAVLMLDDIASELDEKRREALFCLLREEAGQVFITTTDPNLIPPEPSGDIRYFEVKDGHVFPGSTQMR